MTTRRRSTGLRELLARWKFHVLAVDVAEEAQALADTQPIDIVLADFHLQERPAGLDLLQRLVHAALARAAARAGALLTADATEMLALAGGRARVFRCCESRAPGGVARADFGAGRSRRARESGVLFGSRRRELMQRQALRDQHRLRAIFGAHLFEDGRHVRLDRGL